MQGAPDVNREIKTRKSCSDSAIQIGLSPIPSWLVTLQEKILYVISRPFSIDVEVDGTVFIFSKWSDKTFRARFKGSRVPDRSHYHLLPSLFHDKQEPSYTRLN